MNSHDQAEYEAQLNSAFDHLKEAESALKIALSRLNNGGAKTEEAFHLKNIQETASALALLLYPGDLHC